MPEPWELTNEQIKAERERLAHRLRAADLADAAFFLQQVYDESPPEEGQPPRE